MTRILIEWSPAIAGGMYVGGSCGSLRRSAQCGSITASASAPGTSSYLIAMVISVLHLPGNHKVPSGTMSHMDIKQSVLSIRSEESVLSIGSKGSILSIGSIGSVMSIGSIGSTLSAFSIASFASAGSVASFLSYGSTLSALSRNSIMSWRSNRGVLRPGRLGENGFATPRACRIGRWCVSCVGQRFG